MFTMFNVVLESPPCAETAKAEFTAARQKPKNVEERSIAELEYDSAADEMKIRVVLSSRRRKD